MKTPKLTPNQVRLLRKAAESRHGTVTTGLVGGHGPEGGSISYGARDSNSCCKLRDLGLLVFVRQYQSSDARNGWTQRFTDTTWEITMMGRSVLAALDARTKQENKK